MVLSQLHKTVPEGSQSFFYPIYMGAFVADHWNLEIRQFKAEVLGRKIRDGFPPGPKTFQDLIKTVVRLGALGRFFFRQDYEGLELISKGLYRRQGFSGFKAQERAVALEKLLKFFQVLGRRRPAFENERGVRQV